MFDWLRSRITRKPTRIEQPQNQPLVVKRAPGSSTTRGTTKQPIALAKAQRRRRNKLASASRKANR